MRRVLMTATLLVPGVLLVACGEDAQPSSASERPSSQHCAGCHSEIAREMAESWHGQAMTDSDYLKLSHDATDPACISCHAPTPIFEIGVGERVFERKDRLIDGVDCISCHWMKDGHVAGSRGLTDAPCRPVKEPKLATASFCAGCHNQHWTVDEWMASSWAGKKSCVGCHMPRTEQPRAIADGGPLREGVRTHRFEGGHYKWMLEKAVTLEASIDGHVLTVRVTNSGAGHKLPTDSRHKSMNLLVTVRDEAGDIVVDQEELAEYRLYYRPDKIPPTQIEPGETREHTYEIKDVEKGRVVVELVYCLKPPQKISKDWTPVKQLELDF